jgi:putative 4-mercaptohistidine N1-methyltranferase
MSTSQNIATASNSGKGDNVYETDAILNQYLGLHYPSSKSVDGNLSPILEHANAPVHGLRFPQRIAQWLTGLSGVKDDTSQQSTRALDVGCAVGGSSFELACSFSKVDAFDFSANFIRAAERMKRMEHPTFDVPLEGDISETMIARHENKITATIASRVNFFVGDACKMTEMIRTSDSQQESPSLMANGYDAILLANLLCRLPDPMSCLEALPLLIKPQGVVVILTPFTWLEEFTPRDKWLGGCYTHDDADKSEDPPSKKHRGVPCRGIDRLEEKMNSLGFVNIGRQEMPLVIREHMRKYQYIISHATGWKKT